MGKDISIYMSMYDKVSPTLKALGNNAKAFDKTMQELEQTCKSYEKRQNSLTGELSALKGKLVESKEAVKEATRAWKANQDELSRGALDKAIEQQERLKQAIKDTETAQRENRKTFNAYLDDVRKGENSLQESEGASRWGLVSALGKDLVSGALGGFASAALSSAIGEPQARLISNTVSSAISGVMTGAIAGLPGAAIGALVGAGAGFLSGEAEIFQARDDAFQSYYQGGTQNALEGQAAMLDSGSALAAQREKDRISFSTLFKDQQMAERYLEGLVDMANHTPFLYDDLTAMSKTLATYGYGADSILPVLQTIGDTGAALGMGTSDMSAVAQALGRMKSSDKTTLEYLNILNDRGIGAVGMLADAYGVDQGSMYSMISKGEIAGGEAAEMILAALTDSFAGSMEEQSRTFSGLSSTVEGLQQELNNAMGEGYNETRKAGLEAETQWLSGENGEGMQEAYRMMGQWQASLENTKAQLEREALEAVMSGTISDGYADSSQRERLEQMAQEYRAALAEYEAGNEEAGAQMGALLAEAQVIALNEYNASEGAQLALESELSLAARIRDDTASNDAFWDAGYQKGQEFSKGLMAGIKEDHYAHMAQLEAASNITATYVNADGQQVDLLGNPIGYAAGLSYVPYDNFPALLHQGERVLTASQARAADGAAGGGIVVHMGDVTIREEADVVRIAQEFVRQAQRASLLAAP